MRINFTFTLIVFLSCIAWTASASRNPSVVYRQVGYKYDSYVKSEWSAIDSSQTSDYIYDSLGNLKKQYVRQRNGNAWIPHYYDERTFNAQNKPLTYYRYYWDSIYSVYSNNSYTVYSYDAHDNLLSDTIYHWSDSINIWIPYFFSSYTYDEHSYETGNDYYEWDTSSGSWRIENSISYIYNHGKSYETKYAYWYKGVLDNAYTDQYTFDTAGNILTDSNAYWDPEQMKWDSTYTIYKYNAANEVTLRLSMTYDALHGAYYTSEIDSSIYDLRNYLIEEYYSSYNLNSSDYSYKYNYTNDSSGNNLIELMYILTNGAWQIYFKDSMQYDSHNNWTLMVYQYWDSTRWTNSSYNKLEINYNTNNVVYEQTQNLFNWQNDHWVLQYRGTYKYDSHHDLIFLLQQNNNSNGLNGNDTLNMTGVRYFYSYEILEVYKGDTGTNAIDIYPIPASQTLNIALPEAYLNAPYAIYDILGHKMISGYLTGNNYSIDVSGYSDGMYVLKVNNDGQDITRKFVVKR